MNAKPTKPFRPRPVLFVWDGDVMTPLPRFRQLCDKQFAVHEEYALSIVENRSQASHNHYFAAVADAFSNLAEEFNGQFPTPEHLRAWALVQCGYSTETDTVCDSPAEARKLGAVIRRYSPYAIMKISGNVLKIFEPESQSHAAMKKERFEASKADVLALVSGMARTTPAELKKNAGRSA